MKITGYFKCFKILATTLTPPSLIPLGVILFMALSTLMVENNKLKNIVLQ